jgi:ring-1,2-phenylacetyl-CoA epoxidase subunit PaaC
MTTLAALPTTALAELLTTMADDEFVIGWSDSEWTGIAPLLEEDVAMSSLAQDELGHAAALYDLLADLVGADRDALAYDRAPDDYRHARLLDHGRGDWAMTIARRWLYETADATRLQAAAASSWAPLRELVAKIQREERYHLRHVATWFERLAAVAGEPRDRLEAALATLRADAATVFTPLPGETALLDAGILAVAATDQERTWRSVVTPTLERIGLPGLPADPAPADGRGPDHGPDFAWLHGEFTLVRHADPGATW